MVVRRDGNNNLQGEVAAGNAARLSVFDFFGSGRSSGGNRGGGGTGALPPAAAALMMLGQRPGHVPLIRADVLRGEVEVVVGSASSRSRRREAGFAWVCRDGVVDGVV